MSGKGLRIVGVTAPADKEAIFNDTPLCAVLLREKMGFNFRTVRGVIQIAGCYAEETSANDVHDAMERGPAYLDAAGARRLAALLIKAADAAEGDGRARARRRGAAA